MSSTRPMIAVLLSGMLVSPGISWGQGPTGVAGTAAQTPPKYKLTILEGASTSKRVKKGRVSSQAVVMVTDENDVPVPGILVTFLIPEIGSGGAVFTNGSHSTVVATNAKGVASSGSFSTAAGNSFSVGVTASVPGGMLTGTVPVSAAAAAAGAGAAGGVAAGAGAAGAAHTGLIIAVAVVAVGAGVGAAAASGAFGGNNQKQQQQTASVTSIISVSFGGPK